MADTKKKNDEAVKVSGFGGGRRIKESILEQTPTQPVPASATEATKTAAGEPEKK